MSESFIIWTGGSYVNVTCCERDCDHTLRFEGMTKLEVIIEAAKAHDCWEDKRE